MDRSQILGLLERKSALYVLLEVKEHPWSSKSEIKDKENINRRTKFVRIQELVEAGLLIENREPRQHAIVKLNLSPEGQEIADHILKIVDSAKSLPELKHEE